VLVVLDTSVLIAAFRSTLGASFQLLRLLEAQAFRIAISVPLVLEYESVLLRHCAELGQPVEDAIELVKFFCSIGQKQDIHFLWRPLLSEPKDEHILELAVAAGCEAIVTHNVRHLQGASTFRIQVLTPGGFLRRLKEKQ
jgi:predicted nucleic acid-binding protein